MVMRWKSYTLQFVLVFQVLLLMFHLSMELSEFILSG